MCLHTCMSDILIGENSILILGQNGDKLTLLVLDECIGISSQPENDFISFLVIWNGVVTKLKKVNLDISGMYYVAVHTCRSQLPIPVRNSNVTTILTNIVNIGGKLHNKFPEMFITNMRIYICYHGGSLYHTVLHDVTFLFGNVF